MSKLRGNWKIGGTLVILTILAFLGLNKVASPAVVTLLLLATAFVFFFTEIVPVGFTALMVPVILSATGILKADTAFSYFGNKWVLLFLFMFIVGEGMFRTGAAQDIGKKVVKAAGKSEVRLALFIMLVTEILSAFLSNTATTASLLPIVIAAAYAAEVSPKKLLLPLAWAASLGGSLTLIGTPPNGIINATLEDLGLQPFGFFDFGKVGICIVIVGTTLAITVGLRLLPSEDVPGVVAMKSVDESQLRRDRKWLSIVIFITTVVLMMGKILPYQTAAALGALLVVAFGIVTPKEAYNAVSWTTIFLFAGMLPLGKAMVTTGAAEMVAKAIVAHMHSPRMILLGVMLITFSLGNTMSHTATAAIMAPLVVSIAQTAGISPYPLLMGAAMTASTGMSIPISTPPNTIVFEPGGYTFWDYLKAGILIEIALFITVYIVTPILWSF